MQSIELKLEKQDFRTKEAFKTLRTNIEFSGENIRVICVTSCTPNEGKSSVSYELAKSFAQNGKKTILIDADLRKSVMRGRHKKGKVRFGLTNYLVGKVDLDTAICETDIPNFHLLFAGPVPPNPSELLGNTRFQKMVEACRMKYDMVIIDTPPLGSVIDTAVVSKFCDGAVIILACGEISYRFAKRVKDQLAMTGCKILGCVLNKVEMSGKGYYGKYYGNCTLNRLDYLQEQGLMSSLPLANNLVPIKRALTTTSTAIFVPFTTQELFMEGDSLYYGLNAVSNNMIMADRKQLKNPNGLILGTPGSGKSFSAKREITNVFFTTTDDIIVADPEGEYYPLVEALGGQVIHISSTSKDYINPMDINLNYADDDNPLGMKSDFILSLCELIMGARDGMEPEEKSVIDRCLPLVYQKYLNNPKPENMPTLGDLYDCLREQKERQAQRIATALEIYVNGSLRVFNHQTNVELDNRIICFDIKELGKQLKKLGMLIVQDQVWNRVTINRNSKKNTRYYIDEFHLLLKEEQTAAYSVEIWKRFRKWGGVPTGITQNIKDLLASREIENIFENSDFIYMLNQASGDRQILAKQLNISPFQLSYVTNSNEGEGLLFYGNTIIPFKDKFDTSLKLYSLMTTKPNEMGKYKEKKEA